MRFIRVYLLSVWLWICKELKKYDHYTGQIKMTDYSKE